MKYAIRYKNKITDAIDYLKAYPNDTPRSYYQYTSDVKNARPLSKVEADRYMCNWRDTIEYTVDIIQMER